MPKFRKPFFKQSHRAWYVQLDGKQVRLAETEDEAFDRYHELMAERKRAARFLTPNVATPYTLGRLHAEFLASAFKDRSEKTRGFYEEKLTPLVHHLGDEFPAGELKPLHVEEWVTLHPKWKKGTVRTVWQAVQRLMRWGENSGRVPHSLVCDYQKPGATRRTVVISPETYRDVVVPNIPSPAFRDLVAIAWEVGARPQEFLKAEARHYDRSGKRLVLPPEEAKVDKWPRVIYLTHCVDTLTKDEFLGSVGREKSYYSFDSGGVHFVVLDACFRSDGKPYGRKNSKWTDANVPAAELDWLKEDLKGTDRKVVVFAHQRLDVASDYGVKNAADVRKVLEGAGKVLCVFQGHSHKNDYKDVGGVHYCTLVGMIEGSGAENNGYSVLDVAPDGTMIVTGFRKQKSYDWRRRPK